MAALFMQTCLNVVLTRTLPVLLLVCAHECFEHLLLYFAAANRWLMLRGIYGNTNGFTESLIFQYAQLNYKSSLVK